MTIDEAIMMLSAILRDREEYTGSMGNDAIELGIEALKRVQNERLLPTYHYTNKLPGETEE